MLPKDIEDIIHKQKVSMIVSEVNEQIKKLNYKVVQTDDMFYISDFGALDLNGKANNVFVISTNHNFKIKSLYLDYQSRRDMGDCQWSYVCNKCGEFLKSVEVTFTSSYDEQDEFQRDYYCKCHKYYCGGW